MPSTTTSLSSWHPQLWPAAPATGLLLELLLPDTAPSYYYWWGP
jgi:hypothetical protein